MSAQDRKKFSVSSFGEKPDHGKSGSSDVNVLYSAVYKSPVFISQIIAERKKQVDSNGHLIHVNPKFLPLNQQGLKGCNSGKQEFCGDTKSRYHYVNRRFLHGNVQVQNSLAVPQLLKQNVDSGVNSGLVSSICSSDTKMKGMNKIEICPDKDVTEKIYTNKNANISCQNLQSKSVYINPNFTPHMLPIKSGFIESKDLTEKGSIKTCDDKVTQSIHVNPTFSHCQETLHSLRLEKTNCGTYKLQGKSHALCAHVKETKHVFINPKLTVLNQTSGEHSCFNVVPSFPEEIGSTAKKNGNISNDESTCLLNAKMNLNAMPPPLIQVEQESRIANVSDSVFGEKRLTHNSNVSRALGITDTVSPSKNVPRSSLVLLSKRKLIRCSNQSSDKRTCEEQQMVVALNSNRKLVKKRTLSSSSRHSRNIEPCNSMKLASRVSPFSQPVKMVRSLRTKYKFVRNLSVHDKQEGMKNLGSSMLKSQKCSSGGKLSSGATNQEKRTNNSSALVEQNGNQNSLILLSKTKLIRRGAKCALGKNSKDHRMVVVSVNARKLVKRRRSSLNISPKQVKLTPRTSLQVPSVKVARSVRTKYKYIRNLSDQKGMRMVSTLTPSGSRSRCYVKSKYKIDLRAQHSPRIVKSTKKRRVNYGGMQWHGTPRTSLHSHAKKAASQRLFHKKPPAPGNLVWKNSNYAQLKRLNSTNRRFQQIRRQRNNMLKYNSGGVSSMVKIGGVLYKCSVNKLTRTSICGEKKAANSKLVPTGGHILHVRGSTFLMEPTGKTMRRIDAPSAHNLRARSQKVTSPITRVDIGGVTYLQKSQNVLIRTDYHRARNILSQAKQRSIATLMQKMKKNNQPCAFYQRFGKCSRKDKGCCPRVHDPKQIAVCKKFLQGQCQVTGCTLSHDVVPEKMATCRFFLEGVCVRDNCPYLHVKLNSKAGICLGFLQGYCAEGDKCQKRHINICPEFDKLGKCLRGKFCPYPHKVGPKPRAKKQSLPKTSDSVRSQEVFSEKTIVHRYYEDPSISKPRDVADNMDDAAASESCPQHSQEENDIAELNDDLDIAVKRRRLEPMPDYIAFK